MTKSMMDYTVVAKFQDYEVVLPVVEVVDILDHAGMVEFRQESNLVLDLTHPSVTFSVVSSLMPLEFLLSLLMIFTAFRLPCLLSRIS